MTREAPRFTAHGPGTPAQVWSDALRPGRHPLDLDGVRRVVVVAAHPDDESLGAGGLVSRAVQRGIPVRSRPSRRATPTATSSSPSTR